MARDGIVTLFNVDDCKIKKITTDTSASLAFGTNTDVPGISNLSIKPEFLSKELYGDAQILDTYSKLRKITGSVKHAMLSFPVLAIITGGAVTDTGITPNEVGTFNWLGANLPPFWHLECTVNYQGGLDAGGTGDFHFVIHKGKMTNFEIEAQGEDYATVSFDFEGIPCKNNDKVMSLVENETAVALVAGASDTTAPTFTCSPTDGATGVSVSADIVATASEDLQPSTVSSDNVFLEATVAGTIFAGVITYSAAADTITFNPTGNLAGATAYTFHITTGVRDLAGNPPATHQVFNFTTA
jgi:hypothetical protein